MSLQRLKTTLVIAAIGALLIVVVPAANANHAWSRYHWERSENPLVLAFDDNVDATWDTHLGKALTDWQKSSVLDVFVADGTGDWSPGACDRVARDHVEVCNGDYGDNGWLGVAGISVEKGKHIIAGYVKVNDYYFSQAPYNGDGVASAWRQMVMCQEVGHIFGLGHNDEDFSTTNGTCMDYSNDPVPNQEPDAHDFEQLAEIYSHLDGVKDGGGGDKDKGGGPPAGKGKPAGAADASAWGREVASDGHSSAFVRQDGDTMWVTHVIWAN